MEHVDYQKLSEQYASFLIAVGGVSITVLALVLTLNFNSGESDEPTEGDERSFLVTALVVGALSCFVGAQMMAETAAFTRQTEKADRLFLLASSNIFVAIILAFFALMLIPLALGKVHRNSIKPISMLFFLILFGALYWAVLAGLYRMDVPGRESAMWGALVISLIWVFFFYYLTKPKKWSFLTKLVKWVLPTKLLKRLLRTRSSKQWLRWEVLPKKWQLWLTFAPSALLTAVSLVWFTWIFSTGSEALLLHATIHEGRFFCLSIGLSYGSMLVAGVNTICKEQSAKAKLKKIRMRQREQRRRAPRKGGTPPTT